jgi:hypothetical protein
MSFLDFFGEVFLFAIFLAPLFSFLIVRKTGLDNFSKLALGIVIMVSLGAIFFLIGFNIILRNGLGPDSVY